MAAGRKGYCSLSVKKMAWELNLGLTQLHVYIKELIEIGYLERQAHPGRPNTWVISEVRVMATGSHNPSGQPEDCNGVTPSASRRTIFKSKYKNNVNNVVNFCEQEKSKTKTTKPFDMALVKEIESVVGTSKDRGCWIKIVRECSVDTIRTALSSLKMAEHDGTIIAKPAAYLVKIVKQSHPDLFCKARTGDYASPISQPEHVQKTETYIPREAEITNPIEQPLSWEENLKRLKELKSQLQAATKKVLTKL
jgi:hypothetical protein